jgi:IS1 family transposase
MRATSRITGAARNTVDKLLVDLGEVASEYQDTALRNLPCRRLECDEIWAFVYSKQKNVPENYDGDARGDVWTWTAIDAESKLVPSWLVGERTNKDCYLFLSDLRSRLRPGRIQLTTDGLGSYFEVVEPLFGADRVDFAQLIKQYGGPDDVNHRYTPPECTGINVRKVTGEPNPNYISTSYVERQNLTMRMNMRRFTRLTNAFSKKVENHAASVSLHFLSYNFARPHQTLTKRHGRKTTPAMAAGVAEHVWHVREIAGLLG